MACTFPTNLLFFGELSLKQNESTRRNKTCGCAGCRGSWIMFGKIWQIWMALNKMKSSTVYIYTLGFKPPFFCGRFAEQPYFRTPPPSPKEVSIGFQSVVVAFQTWQALPLMVVQPCKSLQCRVKPASFQTCGSCNTKPTQNILGQKGSYPIVDLSVLGATSYKKNIPCGVHAMYYMI